MRILITGYDGYEGWPLLQTLTRGGHAVLGIDTCARRSWVAQAGGDSVIPIASERDRIECAGGEGAAILRGDVRHDMDSAITMLGPEVVIHLAEQPSAPYSMLRDGHGPQFTAENNFGATVTLLDKLRQYAPDAHLIYVSTMGVYGTPPIRIREGVWAPEDAVEYRADGDTDNIGGLVTPRQPSSIYHISKVASGAAVDAACRMWGLRCTTLYQGVVYGTDHPEGGKERIFNTRLDVDEAFGTVFNRFCAQAALGIPMTIYGSGGQTRGMISLWDAVSAMRDIALASPPEPGKQCHMNQIGEIASVRDMATKVHQAANSGFDLSAPIECVENPRVEAGEHEYHVDADNYRAAYPRDVMTLDDGVSDVLGRMMEYRGHLESLRDCIAPKTQWKGSA